MQKVVAFVRAHVILVVSLVLIAIFVTFGFVWLQNGTNIETVLVVEPGSFVQQVSVSGRVVPTLDIALGFTQGGRTKNLTVAVGDRVQSGEVLAEIENDDVRALLLQREAILASEQANLQSLLDGVRPEEIAVSEAAVNSAKIALAQSEQAVVDKIQDAFRAAENAVRVHIDQFISNPRSQSPTLVFTTSNSQARTNIENQRPGIETILTRWHDAVSALDTSHEVETTLASTKQDLINISAFLAVASSAVSQAVVSGSVTATILDGYAADVAAARIAVNSAITSITVAETNMRSAESTLVSAEKSLALKTATATASSVASQEAKVSAARASVLDAQAQLSKTFVRAPFDGVISDVNVEVGETVQAGIPVISLISDDALQIESFVPEINIALLEVGDPAMVTLDAYGDAIIFNTIVTSIDPAETVRDGVSTYRAVLTFIENDVRIKPGMTANIMITTVEKENVIAVPRGVVIFEDGKKYVPVKVGESIELKEVETGLISSLGTIEIIKGLNPGDVVVLDR